MNLKGKIAVVVGATGGIGREISKALAKEGPELLLVARKQDTLDVLKGEIEEKGGKAQTFVADLTNEESVTKLAEFVNKFYGRVDILFNTAGIGVYKKFPEVTYEDWRLQMAVNVDAVFLVIQKLLPGLLKSEKAYVFSMGSGMGKIAVSGRSPYCTSKFALRGLMQSLAKEYAKTHIHFVLLTLGSVMTPFGPLSLDDKQEKAKKGKVYLDPSWLAGHIVNKLNNETFEPETPIYPKHYFEESKEGKT